MFGTPAVPYAVIECHGKTVVCLVFEHWRDFIRKVGSHVKSLRYETSLHGYEANNTSGLFHSALTIEPNVWCPDVPYAVIG